LSSDTESGKKSGIPEGTEAAVGVFKVKRLEVAPVF